jgi:hypothetical protein
VAMDAKKRQASNFSETLICRCPEALADAIERAAASEMISRAAYARRAVMTALPMRQRGRRVMLFALAWHLPRVPPAPPAYRQ